MRLIGPDWEVPDFSTLSRRQKTLAVSIPYRGSQGPRPPPVRVNRRGVLPELLDRIPSDQEIASVTAPSRGLQANRERGRPRRCRNHPAPQERQTMEARHRRSNRPQRSPARITALRSNHLTTMERLSPPKPRRNMSRARKRSGPENDSGDRFPGEWMHCVKLPRPASGRAGLRPSGRRVPDRCRCPERLYHARNSRH